MCDKCAEYKKIVEKHESTLNKIQTELNDYLNTAKEYILQLACDFDTEVDEALRASKEELPLLINSDRPLIQKLVKNRLKDIDYKPEAKDLMEILYDSSFDYEEYKGLGWNDGTLSVISTLYRMLGKEDKMKEAYLYQYD